MWVNSLFRNLDWAHVNIRAAIRCRQRISVFQTGRKGPETSTDLYSTPKWSEQEDAAEDAAVDTAVALLYGEIYGGFAVTAFSAENMQKVPAPEHQGHFREISPQYYNTSNYILNPLEDFSLFPFIIMISMGKLNLQSIMTEMTHVILRNYIQAWVSMCVRVL